MNRLERTIIFNGRHGLHIRPASDLARIACSHESEIVFFRDGNHADARSIFELLILGIKHGDLVGIVAEGHDAEAAMDALDVFLESCSIQGDSPPAHGPDLDSCAA